MVGVTLLSEHMVPRILRLSPSPPGHAAVDRDGGRGTGAVFPSLP